MIIQCEHQIFTNFYFVAKRIDCGEKPEAQTKVQPVSVRILIVIGITIGIVSITTQA
jgi:hypothetical protein